MKGPKLTVVASCEGCDFLRRRWPEHHELCCSDAPGRLVELLDHRPHVGCRYIPDVLRGYWTN